MNEWAAAPIVISALAIDLVACGTEGFVLDLADAATGVSPIEVSDGGGRPSAPDASSPSGSDTSAEASAEASTDASLASPPSCSTGDVGTISCGALGDSCCTSLPVASGAYDRTYTNTGNGATGQANPATISAFRLDKYDVTVGRFRQFANAVADGYLPLQGSGKHTHVNDGRGLANVAAPGSFETGWVTSDNSNIAPTTATLMCDPTHATWTDMPGGNENLPINCANWYEAYAFCIWDGGFLPSEAEWEYAAAGGGAEREYPWGTAAPGTANRYAIYGCYYPTGTARCQGVPNIAPVGTATLGAGLWGQLDLAGEIYQWTLDSEVDYVDPCNDCANLNPGMMLRVRRGGAFGYDETLLHGSVRKGDGATKRDPNYGFRCARTP